MTQRQKVLNFLCQEPEMWTTAQEMMADVLLTPNDLGAVLRAAVRGGLLEQRERDADTTPIGRRPVWEYRPTREGLQFMGSAVSN